ncbi:MAG: AraC family transcriptional regulator [Muribaculaceae bacterium]|nr:AraC family transcriptional regulator [Muribaculaceae bacterium]
MIESFFVTLPCITCLVCAMFLLIKWYGNRLPHTGWLTVFFVAATLLYLCHGFYFLHERHFLPATNTLYVICNLLVYPLFYIYLTSLTQTRQSLSLRWVTFAIPMLMGTAVGVIYLMMSHSERAQFIDGYLYRLVPVSTQGIGGWQVGLHTVSKVLFAIQVVFVLIAGWLTIKRFNHRVTLFYANTEGRTLETLRWLMMCFIATGVFSFAANILGPASFDGAPWAVAIASTLFSALLFMLAQIGMRHDFSATQIEEEMLKAPLDEPADTCEENQISTENTEEKYTELRERIKALVVEEKLYLKPDLKVADLSQRLSTNRRYIYEAINGNMGVSFAEFINGLRINHAKQLMRNHPQLTMAEVAEQSGYHSLSSFYRNLKRYKDKE